MLGILGIVNKKDHKELKTLIEDLAEFAAERFTFVAQKFSLLETKIEFLVDTKADKVDVERIVEEVSERKKNEVLGTIDAYAKRSDDRQQEHDMLVRQIDRHDGWIKKIARKTDVKLDY